MVIKRLKLKKLNNTRDLGGLPTSDGLEIKRGKLIRSGKLSDLPACTIAALKKIGVTTVIDLRISTERQQHPDTQIDGINYFWLPVLCTSTPGVTSDSSMRHTMLKESRRIKDEFGTADNYMIETYRSILFNEQPQQELKKFLRIVIEEEGTVLWHCTSGKDRGGICAMLVEALLGADEETIISDYLASRKFWRKQYSLNRFVLAIAPVSLKLKKILFGFMRTKREYLETVINDMKARYGGIAEYCKQVLEVTDKDIITLKKKYLV